MVRAANTGVSAVIDAYGRVLAALDMEREGCNRSCPSTGAGGDALR